MTVHKFPKVYEFSALTMEDLTNRCLPVQELSNLINRVTLISDLDCVELQILSGARKVSVGTDQGLVDSLSACLKVMLNKRL